MVVRSGMCRRAKCCASIETLIIDYSPALNFHFTKSRGNLNPKDLNMETLKTIRYTPIGIIHSPFREPVGVPIQAAAARGIRGTVEIYQEYSDGLEDIDGFSHLILIYEFHLAGKRSLKVKPFMDDREHGVFATRAPNRPNPIGFSVVKLIKQENNILHIEDLDIVDGTPLLDIKPYIPDLEAVTDIRTGWFSLVKHALPSKTNDGRFEP